MNQVLNTVIICNKYVLNDLLEAINTVLNDLLNHVLNTVINMY